MAKRIRSWRGLGAGVLLVLGLTTLAYAQYGASPGSRVIEYTQQEVQANALVETLNEMGKQHWEIFQVVPVWKFQDQGGGAEMAPIRYQIIGRRAKAEEK
jgi:hypothetical protein